MDIIIARGGIKLALRSINSDILASINARDGKYGILCERRATLERALFAIDDAGLEIYGREAYLRMVEVE